jgi:carbamoyl-phosphate synthase large subunit
VRLLADARPVWVKEPNLVVSAILLNIGRNLSLIDTMASGFAVAGVSVVAGYVDADSPVAHSEVKAFAHLAPNEHGVGVDLFDVARQHDATIVVPTADDELEYLSRCRAEFAAEGIYVSVSEARFVEVCSDKLLTARAFDDLGVLSPATWDPIHDSAPHDIGLDDDVILKPRRGASGIGVGLVRLRNAPAAAEKFAAPLLQAVQIGIEYTLDAYFSESCELVHYVCRKRGLVAGGQSVHGETVRTERSEQFTVLALRACGQLGARGIVNVQAFDDGTRFRLGEVNARVASGFPLAYAAGGRYPELIASEATGAPLPRLGEYTVGVAFARGTRDVFWHR